MLGIKTPFKTTASIDDIISITFIKNHFYIMFVCHISQCTFNYNNTDTHVIVLFT